MKLLIHSQNSLVELLKFGNGNVISSHILLGIWLFIHVGIKLIHVSKRAPFVNKCVTKEEIFWLLYIRFRRCKSLYNLDIYYKLWKKNLVTCVSNLIILFYNYEVCYSITIWTQSVRSVNCDLGGLTSISQSSSGGEIVTNVWHITDCECIMINPFGAESRIFQENYR